MNTDLMSLRNAPEDTEGFDARYELNSDTFFPRKSGGPRLVASGG